MIRRIPAEHIARHAGHIRALAQMGDEWWTEAELWADLAAGRRALFDVHGQAVALVRVCGQALFIDALLGHGWAEWGHEFDAAMKAEARRLGLKEVAARCRRGFAPFGRRHGWRETHREYRTEV